jgi:hypothetical protein
MNTSAKDAVTVSVSMPDSEPMPLAHSTIMAPIANR